MRTKIIGLTNYHDGTRSMRLLVSRCGSWQGLHTLQTFVILRKLGASRERALALSFVLFR